MTTDDMVCWDSLNWELVGRNFRLGGLVSIAMYYQINWLYPNEMFIVEFSATEYEYFDDSRKVKTES